MFRIKQNTNRLYNILFKVEKYARQALSEGVTDPAELRVTRDCDMFKALNNHYNKTNEFEVFIRCYT